MAPRKFFNLGTYIFLVLFTTAQALPANEYGTFDDRSVLPLGSSFIPHVDNVEFRGVLNGRKTRYIVERASKKQCCRKKPVCSSVLGSIASECSCKKCSPGFPSADGKSCQDKCPEGQEANGSGGCCPSGMRPNKKGNECECPEGKVIQAGGKGCKDDSERESKGKCPDGQILDQKVGQKPDVTDPKCQIDDSKTCTKPKIPATRPEGKENDSSYTVECGQPEDESKRPKCDRKTHYADVWVDSDGKAHEECLKTKDFKDWKKKKVPSLKSKFKDKWNKQKDQRDKDEKERKEKLKTLKEHRENLQKQIEERDRLKDQNDKKKARMGKCATVTALMMGLAENLAQKRDEEHPYDWTTEFFDEEFVLSDERLADFPTDIDIDKIPCSNDECTDIDAEAWMKEWQEQAQAHDLKENWRTCTQIGKRGIFARCPAKRSPRLGGDVSSGNVSSIQDSQVPGLVTSTALVHCHGKHSACMTELEKRNPLIGILIELGMFGARLGVSLLTRAATSIARWAPRLANIAKNTDRLFKIAQNGKAGARSVDSMKEAFGKIAKNPNFRKCLKDGVP